eukprot:GDKJ01016381.1.p1 GENE.GDKJ01016381.1~~GDKJ01016381.1.p1  ORF type:complete len:101 (-),score=21.04 GDKJ01016381.1:18-320(-)
MGSCIMSGSVKISFGGGLELITGCKECSLKIEKPITALDVIRHVRDNVVFERASLFAIGDEIRPGILVLVDECDWELLDTIEAEVKDGTTVHFISTLHGG